MLYDMTTQVLGEGADADEALSCLRARFEQLVVDDEMLDTLCNIDEAIEVLDRNDEHCVADEKTVMQNRRRQHAAYSAEYRRKAASVRAAKSTAAAGGAGKAAILIFIFEYTTAIV